MEIYILMSFFKLYVSSDTGEYLGYVKIFLSFPTLFLGSTTGWCIVSVCVEINIGTTGKKINLFWLFVFRVYCPPLSLTLSLFAGSLGMDLSIN